MARLPTLGGDTGNWGTVLNDYLSQAHTADGKLRADVATIAALKALNVSTIPDKMQVMIGGYYVPGDGGGGQFYYDASANDADNGGTIIAPPVGTGRWKRIYSGEVNIKWYGAVDDGTTNASPAFAAAIATAGVNSVFIPIGRYRITSAINLTNTQGPFTIRGEGATEKGAGSIIYAETANVGIDCTGALFLCLRDFSLISHGRPTPAKIGILFARSTNPEFLFSESNQINNVLVNIATDMIAFGGRGTVAVYNCAAEVHEYSNVFFKADTALAFVADNVWGVVSPYATIDTSIQSCSQLTVSGSAANLLSRSLTGYSVYLWGAYGVTFLNGYFANRGYGSGANTKGFYIKNTHKVLVRGNFEEMSSLAYLENVSDIVFDVTCTPEASAPIYAPFELAANSTIDNMIFRAYPVVRAITQWPRIIQAGSGAAIHNITIDLFGDDGTLPLTNATDVAAVFRKIVGASSGKGGYKDLHLTGTPLCEGYIGFDAQTSASAPNNSLFMDSADGKLKYKDNLGVVNALY